MIIGGIKRIAKVAERVVPFMAVLYVIGAILVILYNFENIGPAFMSIIDSVFSGSAAVGGFLGASFAYAMQRGVNRGLFSNEAGQGSAAIAHSAAKGKEPASEGMVSLLEPFIDTLIICTLTALVILSSGVWSEKHQNTFDRNDMYFVAGEYTDTNKEDIRALRVFFDTQTDEKSEVQLYDGSISLQDGKPISGGFTLLNARSVAEDVIYKQRDDVTTKLEPITGVITVDKGKLENVDIVVEGKSLIHSASLTAEAFTKGFMGENGKYIVSIGLLLFAFTTAIAWSYYGDRAVTYLFGPTGVHIYRIIYVIMFALAAVVDTTVVWALANVAIVMMTLPNLIGIVLLHKDMKNTVDEYWDDFKKGNTES